ncbi:MAG: phosphonate C-P lyase system protein PhnH [Rhodospirillales bacterium]
MSPAVDTAHLKPGFENPVLDSQATFRAILDAFSFPGRRQTVDRVPDPPAPLMPATAAYLLMIADLDTPVWLDAGANVKPVRDFLRFHCGCPLPEEPAEAAFAIVTAPSRAPRLGKFAQGNELYPDRAATVVFQTASFSDGPAVTARGPGINDTIEFKPDGMPDWFWRDWAVNHAGYPLGIDVLLACGAEVIGMPRSIYLET